MSRAVAVAVCAILLLTGVSFAPVRALAQDATPSPAAAPSLTLGVSLPKGITLAALGEGQADALPNAPLTVALDRITLSPGPAGGQQTAPGPELFYVESGQLSIVDELGIQGDYPKGTPVFLPAGVAFTLSNTGSDPAVALRLSVFTANPSGGTTPVAAAASASPAAGAIAVAPIFHSELKTAPSGAQTLFIYRATFGPKTKLDEHMFSGPVGFLTESGVLGIAGPSGIEGQLKPGKSVALPAGTKNHELNADAKTPAVALMIGVAPKDAPLIVSTQAAASTSTAAAAPTSAAPTDAAKGTKAAVNPTKTPKPKPTATLEATPAAAGPIVIYTADTKKGLADWSGSADWKHLNGMLINDGTMSNSRITSPVQPQVADFAVEAEFQVVKTGNCEGSFGITDDKRDGNAEASAGMTWNDCDPKSWITVGSTNVHGAVFKPGSEWHTYRLEVQGNAVRFFIDGTLQFEQSDNRVVSTTPGIVSLFVSRMQVNIRKFTIMGLPSGG